MVEGALDLEWTFSPLSFILVEGGERLSDMG